MYIGLYIQICIYMLIGYTTQKVTIGTLYTYDCLNYL